MHIPQEMQALGFALSRRPGRRSRSRIILPRIMNGAIQQTVWQNPRLPTSRANPVTNATTSASTISACHELTEMPCQVSYVNSTRVSPPERMASVAIRISHGPHIAYLIQLAQRRLTRTSRTRHIASPIAPAGHSHPQKSRPTTSEAKNSAPKTMKLRSRSPRSHPSGSRLATGSRTSPGTGSPRSPIRCVESFVFSS